MTDDRPIRRRADGRPELRTLDDLLKEAVSGEDYKNLPGKGKPLDLSGYFKSGEDRVVNQILKDNEILPPFLQDRKDAETLQQRADDLLKRESEKLEGMEAEIHEASKPIAAQFESREAVLEALGLDAWPRCFWEPGETSSGASPTELRKATDRLRGQITRYNRCIAALLTGYTDLLAQSNQAIKRYHKALVSTGRNFIGLPPMAEIDIAARKNEIREAFPELPQLPDEIERAGKASKVSGQGILVYILRLFKSVLLTRS